jgi:hypothetical protein
MEYIPNIEISMIINHGKITLKALGYPNGILSLSVTNFDESMIRIAEKIVRITNENEIPFKICLPYT